MCGITFGHPSYTQHHKVHLLGIVFSNTSVVSVVIVSSNYCCCRSVLHNTNIILLCFDISDYFSPVNFIYLLFIYFFSPNRSKRWLLLWVTS